MNLKLPNLKGVLGILVLEGFDQSSAWTHLNFSLQQNEAEKVVLLDQSSFLQPFLENLEENKGLDRIIERGTEIKEIAQT